MKKKGVIFSDVDGTLCFHPETHGIREIARKPDGTVEVEDHSNTSRHLAYAISTRAYQVFLGVEKQRLARQVRKCYDFVYVTGADPQPFGAEWPI